MRAARARFAANRAALVAGCVLLALILMAILAPLITPTGPNDQDFLAQALAFPSAAHPMGIDDLGPISGPGSSMARGYR